MRYLLTIVLCFFFITSAHAVSYSALDKKAANLPIRYSQTKEQLVSELTKDLDSDEAKARIIAAWMVYQIQRNGYEYQKLIQATNNARPAEPPFPNDIFKSRIGTPQEFAELYSELMSLAGVETAIITGYAGWRVPASRYEKPIGQALENITTKINKKSAALRLQQYSAAWNAVKIGEEWKLVDTYWMIYGDTRTGQEMSKSQFERFLKKRMEKMPSLTTVTQSKRLDDVFFFTRPRTFINTHFPDDDKWQLLPAPRPWGSFTR